jgi:hypothetical protein
MFVILPFAPVVDLLLFLQNLKTLSVYQIAPEFVITQATSIQLKSSHFDFLLAASLFNLISDEKLSRESIEAPPVRAIFAEPAPRGRHRMYEKRASTLAA